MPEQPSAPPRRSRGVFWRRFRAGDYLGSRLAEWAYVTPRFPAGIPGSRLPFEPPEVQRETALLWFYANLQPYGVGGPIFGFAEGGGAPFGEGAPPPVVARVALESQFGGSIGAELLSGLGRALGERWEWIEPEPPLSSVLGPDEPSRPEEDLGSLSVEALDRLAALVRRLPSDLDAAHGQIGHNRPPNDLSITERDRSELLEGIEATKTGLTEASPEKAKSSWAKVFSFVERLSKPLLGHLNAFLTAAMPKAGEDFGNHFTDQIILSVGIYTESILVNALLIGYFRAKYKSGKPPGG